MKRIVPLLLLAVVFSGCRSKKNQFFIEGSLDNMNQAQLLLYSTDGVIEGFDTIQVARGQFNYRTTCTAPGTLVLVFPNYVQQPIFAQPGKKVNVNGDVSHLKLFSVSGTKENKLMNKFRETVKDMDPLREQGQAGIFAEAHPESLVALYLVRHYFVESETPNYQRALKLLALISQHQPDNPAIQQLTTQIKYLFTSRIGKRLPIFNLSTIDERHLSQEPFTSSKYAIISTFTPWSATSMDIQHKMRSLKRQHADNLQMLSICIDGNVERCKQTMKRDTIDWNVTCPKELIDAPVLQTLDLQGLPAYLIVKNGSIVKRGTDSREFEKDVNILNQR